MRWGFKTTCFLKASTSQTTKKIQHISPPQLQRGEMRWYFLKCPHIPRYLRIQHISPPQLQRGEMRWILKYLGICDDIFWNAHISPPQLQRGEMRWPPLWRGMPPCFSPEAPNPGTHRDARKYFQIPTSCSAPPPWWVQDAPGFKITFFLKTHTSRSAHQILQKSKKILDALGHLGGYCSLRCAGF